jgi:hypothetical protein
MRGKIFDEIDLRLSTVKRWTIVHTIRQQSVAEHSYNVAIIAEAIARHWFNVTDPARLYEVYRYALEHDREEGITGDVPTIVKDLFNTAAASLRYVKEWPEPSADDQIYAIVKLADRIDALIFLRVEMGMGNQSVRKVLDHVADSFVFGDETLENHFQMFMKKLFPEGVYMVEHLDRR